MRTEKNREMRKTFVSSVPALTPSAVNNVHWVAPYRVEGWVDYPWKSEDCAVLAFSRFVLRLALLKMLSQMGKT